MNSDLPQHFAPPTNWKSVSVDHMSHLVEFAEAELMRTDSGVTTQVLLDQLMDEVSNDPANIRPSADYQNRGKITTVADLLYDLNANNRTLLKSDVTAPAANATDKEKQAYEKKLAATLEGKIEAIFNSKGDPTIDGDVGAKKKAALALLKKELGLK